MRKIDLYQDLELASIDLFRFEAEHAERLKRFQDLTRNDLSVAGATDQDWLIMRKFYEQTMNLFEMAARFRKKKIIEPEVYGSWVIWYYDTLLHWAFREQWADLRQNYTPELRAVFSGFVTEFDPKESDDARKRRFFKHVAEITKCRVVGRWLHDLEEEERPRPRRAA